MITVKNECRVQAFVSFAVSDCLPVAIRQVVHSVYHHIMLVSQFFSNLLIFRQQK